jgi:hypothetical protein
MYNEKTADCRDFETEMWLFLSDEMTGERTAYWNNHLAGCERCSSALGGAVRISSVIKEESLDCIDDASFNRMIDKAVGAKRYDLKSLFGIKPVFGESKSIFGRAAFAASLAVIAIIIALATDQSVQVKSIPSEVLDWNGSGITHQIEEIKGRINNMSEDNWDRQILMIDARIEKMENESREFSFNK